MNKFCFKNIRGLGIVIAALCLLPSCSRSDEAKPFQPSQDDISFELSFETRDDELSDPETGENLYPSRENFSDYFVNDKSIVYIFQRALGLSSDFSPQSPNCYAYKYKENTGANWESGSNFMPVNEALNWGKILENGPFGSGWAFAILFFPEDNNGNYLYEVGEDQNRENDFKKWDILGGYHTTDKVRERLRFQLKHLMCRVKINLYVPVFDVDKGNGYDVSNVDAFAINFRRDYTVSFGGRGMDSEGVPLAMPSSDEGVEPKTADIKMSARPGHPLRFDSGVHPGWHSL